MVRLLIKRFDGTEEELELQKKEIRIGRNDPVGSIINEVNLQDHTVSRRHARIFIEHNAYVLEDLGSMNGTEVNGQSITKVKLAHGDRITIGRNTLLFESQETKTIDPLDYVVDEAHLDHHKTIDANYVILQQVSQMLITQTSLADFLQAVMNMVLQSIKAARGILMLSDPDGSPKLVVTGGKDVLFSEDVVRQVVQEKKSMLVGYDLDASKTMMLRGIQSAICAPLLKDAEVQGVIYLEDPLPGKFREEDLIVLTLFANQVAAGLEKVTLHERLHRESLIRQNLERFLSPRVAELIAKDEGEVFLKSERVTATILFSDIQGFTLLSERLDPQEIAELLTGYFSLMSEIVFAHDGTLDKYLGDGLIAIFGAPFAYPDHPSKAVQAGLKMLERQREFVANLAPEKRFAIRIGVNTGEIMAGYLGSHKRMEYTALGEAVNVANSLQALADPGSIYLGKETYEAVKNDYAAVFVGRVGIPKGRKEIDIYKLSPAEP